MATCWRDNYAVCHFFLRSNSNTITCCGVIDGTRLSWSFPDRKDKDRQMDVFCCGKYQNCEVYRMLKDVYEEE